MPGGSDRGHRRGPCGGDPAGGRGAVPRTRPAPDHGADALEIRRLRTIVAIAIRNAALVLCLVVGLPFAAKAQRCIPDTTPDWMTSIPVGTSSAKVWPADCASVEQSPPDFSWPDLSSDSQYQVTVTYADGRTKTLTAPQNWINWDEVLPAGSYTWQVLVTNAMGTQQSRVRRFTVNAGAVAFLVPDWTEVFNHAVSRPHPRTLPDAATLQAMLDQRQGALSLL